MKGFIVEILDPVIHFYKMRKKSEKLFCTIITLLIGVISYCIPLISKSNSRIMLIEFSNDVLNQFITMLTLFISFSMAYLSIIVSSSSKNVEEMKKRLSNSYFLNNKACTLYQVLVSEITYTLIVEIFFLLYVIFQKFLIAYMGGNFVKLLIATDISLFIHVLILMLVIVKNMYYAFWKSE